MQGIPTNRTCLSQWPREEPCSALCCSCHCSWAWARALGLAGLQWQRRERFCLRLQQTEGPGGHSWVRTHGTLRGSPTLSHPDPAGCQLPLVPQGARLRRALVGPCQLWSLSLPVVELGLGYTSEETVIFHYCAGSCPRGARTQHGLTLARLWGQGRAHGGPCCRPTRYADMAFLDDRHHWQRLPQLSAAACGCG